MAIAVLTVAASTDWPITGGMVTPALAQVVVRTEFREALQPYGSWHRHSHWGDVWVPADRGRDWRPYTAGRWSYTDDWGWYWVSDDTEDAWGWIVYHYGRWVLDPDLGWIWVPGDEWSPGWVQWRRGGEYIGWAPLPPDEVVVEYRDEPDVWIFVRGRDFIASDIDSVILPERQYSAYISDTVVENRTVEFRDQRFAVNPGIAPGVIAAEVGHPIRSFDIRPHVLAGTARINGAIEVRGDELARLRNNREAFRATVRESQRQFQPVQQVPRPQALGANERGRLGNSQLRAVPRGFANAPSAPERNGPGTQGRAQERTQQERTQQEHTQQPERAPQERNQQGRNQQERNPQLPPAMQGLGAPNQRGPERQGRGVGANPPNVQQPQRGEQQGRQTPPRGGPSGERTQGLAPEERRPAQQGGPAQGRDLGFQRGPQPGSQPENSRDLGARENRQPPGRPPEMNRPSTQGMAPRGGEERQFNRPPEMNRPTTQGMAPRGGEERQFTRPPEMNRPSTQGMAPREERQPAPQPQRPAPRPNVGGTEGFAGGGGQRPMAQPQMRPSQPQMQPQGGPGGGGRGRRPGE
ncbi:MAG TPA: DUF6600 domain-containing protein [Xanthobacteraceae bacterium]|nr:DUF6600 domain-containing protein [Xanthobacteraceae bacterium]